MNFYEFNTESKEYQLALKLRQVILRAPLGLDIYEEDLKAEKEQLHFGLMKDDELIACVCVISLDSKIAKIRQMAVSQSFQGQGLGKALLNSTLDELRKKAFQEVILNARKTAVDFYKKYGFKIYSDEFIEVTVPHFKMKKLL